MNLDTLERYLRSLAQGDTLPLPQNLQLGMNLYQLLIRCKAATLPVENWRLERAGNRLVLSGRTALPAIALGRDGLLKLEFTQTGPESAAMSFTLEYAGPFSIEECFGPLAPGYAVAGGLLTEIPSPLAVCTVSRLRLSASGPQGFAFTCAVSIGESSFWSCFPGWRSLAVQASGWLDLVPMWNGGLRFQMELPLAGGSLPGAMLSGLLKSGALTLLIDSGVSGPIPNRPSYERACYLAVRCDLELSGCETPISVTAGLLAGSGSWGFTAEFPNGLTAADIGRVVLSLMGLTDRAALSLPQGMPLDALGLYLLCFEFWGEPLRLRHLRITAGTTRPLSLPLSCLTLENAGISWSAAWDGTHQEISFFQISLTGRLRLELPAGLVLRLRAQAYLPDLELQASLDVGKTVSAFDLMGGVTESLPISLPALGGLELWYAHSSRTLSVSAWTEELTRFSLGGIEITLAQIQVHAGLGPKTSVFEVSGLFRLEPPEREPFALSLSAAYAASAWEFHGWLTEGQADIGGLLSGLLGIQWPDGPSFFVLSELGLSYRTDTGVFFLSAAFHQDWGLIFGKTKVNSGGRLALRSGGKRQVSVMLYLSIGVFEASVQIDNFFDKETQRFLFQLRLEEKLLRAVYERRMLEDGLHDILSLELRNTTLGDLVLLLVRMINPNHRYTLPAPWNLLDRIDLSRFRLEVDLTLCAVSFFCKVNLSIPGLFRLTQVGLRYQNNELFFVIDSEESEQPQRYEWNALYGSPPDAAAKKENTIHLYYLGAASHYTTPALREAATVEEALAAMEEGITPSSSVPSAEFDPDSGWSLGLDLEADRLFRFRLVFHDPILYGARLDVSADRPPLDFFKGLSITLLYRRISQDLGVFQAALILPERLRSFQFGIFGVTFGAISLSVYTNGDFLIDLGYPHGGDFSRSFSLLVGRYYAQGGFYFGVLSQASAPALPASKRGKFSKAISLGVGLSIEFGQRFDFGIVKGGLTLGVMGLFEGLFAIFHGDDGTDTFFYQAEATVGFTGRLFLSADLKIITVSACLTISAQARAALTACRPLELELALALKLSAYIRILFFKIQFSFHFSTTFRCTLGQASPAPWDSLPARKAKRPPLPALRAALLNPSGGPKLLRLTVTPLFSLEEGGERRPCAAFLPVLTQTDFTRLFSLLASWLATVLPEEVLPEDAEMLTDSWLDTALSYENLCEFFEKNLHFTLSAAAPGTDAASEDGCVLPMPPPVTLTLESQGEGGTAFQASYWLDTLVDENYAVRLRDYFEQMQPDPTRPAPPPASKASGGQIPLAQLVFVDYFHMLVRQLAGQLKNAFREYLLDGNLLARSQMLCGAAPAALIAANPQLRLRPGALTLKSAPLILTAEDTFRTLAQRCGCEPSALWSLCGGQKHLLRHGAAFTLGGTFDNRKTKKNLLFCAAYCFVRRHETVLTGGWVSLAQTLAAENPSLPGGMAWEQKDLDRVTLELPGGTWSALPGDTLERLAKTLTVGNLPTGQLPVWDAFWSQVQALNPGGSDSVPDQVLLPEESLTVDGDSDITALGRRLFPQAPQQVLTALEDCPLFEPLRQVVTDQTCMLDQETALSDLAERTGLPLEVIAQAAEQPDCLALGQMVSVRQAVFLHRSLLPKIFSLCQDQAAGMASRFLLQGLRLPRPDESGEDTVPYYQLLRQQAPVDPDHDWIFSVTLQPECGWITGSASAPLSGAKVREQLPDLTLDWRKDLISLVPSPSFAPAPRYYAPKSSLKLLDDGKASVIHLLEGEALDTLPRMASGVTALLDGRELLAVPCLLLPFTVRRKDGMDLLVAGTEAGNRARLLALSSGAECPLFLCVRTSPLQTEGTLSVLPSAGTTLVRTNLSLETHLTPVCQTQNQEEIYCAALDGSGFAQLLWECSVVGGGYILRLSAPLPKDAFEPDGSAQLWLYAPDAPLETANALLTPLSGAGGSFGLGSVSFTPSSELEAPVDLQPLLPRGRYGMDLTLKAPGEEETLENRTHRLFSILDYRVDGSAYAPQRRDSLPLFPQNGPEGNSLYQPVVPLSNLLPEPSGSVYDVLGKQARFNFSCRDVLGNRVDGVMESPAFTPVYNDILIGIHQWPCCRMGYTLLPSNQGPFLELTLFHCAAENQPAETAVQRLGLSLEQLSRPEIQWSLTCALLSEPLPFTASQRDEILNWGRGLLSWLNTPDGAALKPAVLSFALSGAAVPGPEPQPLWVRLHTVRTSFLPAEAAQYPDLSGAVSQIEPLIGPDFLSCEAFAAKLEEALPHAKLARSQESGGSFCLVSTGPEGLLRSISIRPSETFSQGQTAPRYWAGAPLSNRYLSGGTRLFELNSDGTLGEIPVDRQYAQVDLNVWADRFASDLETVLSAQAGRGSVLAPQTIAELLKAKQSLAQSIARQLIPVRSCGPQDDPQPRSILQDRLLRSLSLNDSFACIASYRLEFSSAAHVRLTAHLDTGDTEETCGLTASPGKVDSSQDSFCVLYQANNRARTGFTPKLTLTLTELEYDIQAKTGGYESSRWLAFVLPLESGTPLFTARLNSDLTVPNPLRRCPAPPLLTGHQGEFPPSAPNPAQWRYSVQCEAELYEQDVYQFEISFSDRVMTRSGTGATLFDVLAQYEAIRSPLLAKLAGEDEAVFRNALSVLAQLAGQAAKVWGPVEAPLRAAGENACRAAVRPCFTGDWFSLDTSSDWPGLEALPDDPKQTPGGIGTFTLHVPGLSLFQQRSAQPSVQTFRNTELLRLRKGGEAVETAERFLFCTEPVSLAPLNVSRQCQEPITIAHLPGPMGREALLRASGALLDWLALPGDADLLVSLAVSYLYSLSGTVPDAAVTLPVCLIPQGPPERLASGLPEVLCGWFDKTAPCVQRPALLFRVTVSGKGGAVLDFDCLRVEFDGQTSPP